MPQRIERKIGWVNMQEYRLQKTANLFYQGWVNIPEWWVNINQNGGSTWSRIYNYCDGLCQRCAFRERCAVMQLMDNFEEDDEDRDKAGTLLETPVQFVSSGINLGDMETDEVPAITEEEFAEWEEKQRRWRDCAKNHPLTELAKKYRKDMYKVMTEKFSTAIREKEKELRGLEELGLLSRESLVASLEELAGHLETVMAFQLFFEVKVMTAISGKLEYIEEGDDREEEQQHHNGVMKVVLLSIGKSIRAWKQVKQLVPDLEADAMRSIEILRGMKELAESEFPKAMSFLRPGFDVS